MFDDEMLGEQWGVFSGLIMQKGASGEEDGWERLFDEGLSGPGRESYLKVGRHLGARERFFFFFFKLYFCGQVYITQFSVVTIFKCTIQWY